MGDHYQIIVVRSVPEEDAREWGDRVVARLIERGIIRAEQTDSVLGSTSGHRPGPQSDGYVEEPEKCGHYHALVTNGMEVIAKRTIFYGWTEFPIGCPHCGADLRRAQVDDWSSVVDNWWNRQPEHALRCCACSDSSPVTNLNYGEQVAFEHLGFKFWNWPQLKKALVCEIEDVVKRPTIALAGKL